VTDPIDQAVAAAGHPAEPVEEHRALRIELPSGRVAMLTTPHLGAADQVALMEVIPKVMRDWKAPPTSRILVATRR
jgi:hypothetical protein